MSNNGYFPETQIIDVTLLQRGDYFYPLHQLTNVIKEDEYRCVTKFPRIDRNTGAIVVDTTDGPINFTNGAKVAREVQS